MSHWLFPEFLAESNSYSEAQSYWESLWESVLSRTATECIWEKPSKTNPHADGNPIFSVVSKGCQRGVRIIQEEPPESDEFDLDWWLDYSGELNSPDEIRELAIACCPSQENEAQVQQLLQNWVAKGECVDATKIQAEKR